MRIINIAAITAPLLGLCSEPALSQTATTAPAAPASKAPTTCEVLARDWRSVEWDLANNYAEGVADDSAPRATMRAAQNAEQFAQAQITLQLMRDYKCSLPKRAPSEMTYSLSAMKCRTELMKGNYKAPECDRSTWTPLFGDSPATTAK